MSAEDLQDMKEILVLAREMGVRRLELPQLKFEFWTDDRPPAEAPASPRTVPIGDIHGAPTEDELLFFSSPDPVMPADLEAEVPPE